MNAVQPIRLVVLALALWAMLTTARGDDIRIREDADELLKTSKQGEAGRPEAGVDLKDPKANMTFWAKIHGIPFGVVPPGQCEHVSDLIWPWHHAYLYEFETALRASHPLETSNVALPYWNCTVAPSPVEFENT